MSPGILRKKMCAEWLRVHLCISSSTPGLAIKESRSGNTALSIRSSSKRLETAVAAREVAAQYLLPRLQKLVRCPVKFEAVLPKRRGGLYESLGHPVLALVVDRR